MCGFVFLFEIIAMHLFIAIPGPMDSLVMVGFIVVSQL